jgi:hypothetical protein
MTPTVSSDPANLLAVANEMLARSAPPTGHTRRADRFSAYGINPQNAPAFHTLPPDIQAAWRETSASARTRLTPAFRDGGGVVNGWAVPPRELGEFGENDRLRAAVALGGIAALGRAEAMYFSSVSDSEGRELDGAGAYTLRVPARIPVEAFWSLTMYQAEADGRFFFVDNPIRRYSIGDRTRGLVRNSDGTIDLLLQRERPTDERIANWLPLPAGPCRASFRAYLPSVEMQTGGWTPPPLVRA